MPDGISPPPISPCIFFYWSMKGNANEIFIPAEFQTDSASSRGVGGMRPRRERCGQTDLQKRQGTNQRRREMFRFSVSSAIGSCYSCIVRSFASPAVFEQLTTFLPFCLFGTYLFYTIYICFVTLISCQLEHMDRFACIFLQHLFIYLMFKFSNIYILFFVYFYSIFFHLFICLFVFCF